MKKIIVFIIVLCLFGCEEKSKQNVDKPEGTSFSHNQVWKYSFYNHIDGWIYEMCIISNKTTSTSENVNGNYNLADDFHFSFDGINLKYKQLGESGKPIKDIETGEEVGRYFQSIPSLSFFDDYNAEIKIINEYFNEKKFLNSIQVEDISGLDLSLIDPNLVVDMYNNALAYEPEAFGAFAFIPRVAMNQQVVNDNETWQGGYIIGYGEIARCQFEIITPASYVSDLVAINSASEEQQQLQANIDQLEQAIIDTQVFTKDNISWKYPEVMNMERLQAIDNILEKLYTGEQFGDVK